MTIKKSHAYLFIFALGLITGCVYTADMGDNGPDKPTAPKSKLDTMIDESGYQTDLPEDHGVKEKGWHLPPAPSADYNPTRPFSTQ